MSSSLEFYDAERRDFERVVAAVRKIQAASPDELQSLEWLAQTIREVGLVPLADDGRAYEGEEDWINGSQQGVIQLPREFARCLLLMGETRPATFLEVGCLNGATATLATAYLHRQNPELKATTIDLYPAFIFYPEVRDLIPLRYVVGQTSHAFADQVFDAVFIDGDHSFHWAWADYTNVGRAARCCALHDIDNGAYRALPLGGVCGAWEVIRRDEGGPGIEFTEILEHPSADIFGIGIRVRREPRT